jgi:hypothetical protein
MGTCSRKNRVLSGANKGLTYAASNPCSCYGGGYELVNGNCEPTGVRKIAIFNTTILADVIEEYTGSVNGYQTCGGWSSSTTRAVAWIDPGQTYSYSFSRGTGSWTVDGRTDAGPYVGTSFTIGHTGGSGTYIGAPLEPGTYQSPSAGTPFQPKWGYWNYDGANCDTFNPGGFSPTYPKTYTTALTGSMVYYPVGISQTQYAACVAAGFATSPGNCTQLVFGADDGFFVP